MQRYHAASCNSAVNNSGIGGASARDTARTESSSIPPNFSLNSRRPSQVVPYKIRCDKEPLNSRLGPPDFHPPTPNCPEETLTKEYVQSGYTETIEGLEEAREISLSQVQTFTTAVILKCREEVRKCYRAINESRSQKRKAGQVYEVPLSGTLLSKPGIFPEQKPCGEESRRKWIESLSQQHKRLRSLADHVPHGYRRRSLFEVLIRNNVPLLRATWFIKVTYLNQVRPGSSSISSGLPDKTQFSRSEQWTKDVVDYLQTLLDEFVIRNSTHSTVNIRDRSPQMVYSGSIQTKTDLSLAAVDGEERSLHFKWWYVVRILQWHHAEGLLIPSLVIDWVLNQLQEKELLGVLQLLLPIIYDVIETIVLSQTYVRTLVGIAVRFIREPSPGGSDLVENSRRAYTISALVEMLRYLILAVPDTFVALDCFPLPSSVVSYGVNDGNFMSKIVDSGSKINNGPPDVACVQDKGREAMPEVASIDRVVSSIQKCAETLSRATRPDNPGQNMAQALQELDKTLIHGDVRVAYRCLFENLSDGSVDKHWIAEASSCLRSSLKYIGTMSSSFISSVFFICEWATCDFRDFRTAPPRGMKFTGRKDLSQIYIAVRLLKLKMRDTQTSFWHRDDSIPSNIAKDPNSLNNYSGRTSGRKGFDTPNSKRGELNVKNLSDILESPGPLHDIIVCWIDQHEVQNGEGCKRVQLLIIELIRAGIFYPQAYVRQLIVSGIMDMNGSPVDHVRRKRHYKILKQLPNLYVQDALVEAEIAEPQVVSEAMAVYSNERRLVLKRLLDYENSSLANSSYHKQKHHCSSAGDSASPTSADEWRCLQSASSLYARNVKRSVELEDIKASISLFLQFPCSSSSNGAALGEPQDSVKRSNGSSGSKMDLGEGSAACQECIRVKRQKLSEERSSYPQGYVPVPSDEEDFWWMRKVPKSLESSKADPPPKSAKQASRVRQKVVRKTQSLAQLAAARIEGSQGASTSHVCDSRVSCPHHRTGVDGDVRKSADGIKAHDSADIASIGKVLKQMRFLEKRTTVVWLIAAVKQLVEEAEKVSTVPKVGQYGRPSTAVDDRNSARWKLGEDELSAILYLMDISNELVLAVKFLLWLLPKVLRYPGSLIHGGRNILMLPRNIEDLPCEVGESFLLSSIRRYENIIVAADLIPEALSAVMSRAATTLVPNGRVHSSPALMYARHLLKKYGYTASVVEWEKRFKLTCDKRLVSELESGRLLDGEFGYPLGVPAGVEDPDDFFRQKISGTRVSRVALSMRDIVQRHIDEVFQYYYGKERKPFGPSSMKSQNLENLDDCYQVAHQIVMGLMECMRQTGGAAQEGDPNLVSSAISAIVGNVGQVIAKIPELTANSNQSNVSSISSSLNFARHILRIHVTCLCLLKEALGERQSRVFEVALAVESSSVLLQNFAPGKAPRSQFQLSSDSMESNMNLSNDISNNSTKPVGRAARIAAAVSALVIGALLHGITNLERMVTLYRLKEGLDFIHFIRNMRSNSNGNARSVGAFKVDNLVEVSVHWFRVLVGNCRTVADGFIVDLLGEPAVVALSRMQRTLPLSLVFPPAYSIIAFVIWTPFILNNNLVTRDNNHQLYQSVASAIGDALRHLPFREVCLRDTHALHDLMAVDTVDSEFSAILEMNGLDMHLKATAFVPLRARLFLNALVDCKMPPPVFKKEEGNRMSGHSESKIYHAENKAKLLDKLVHILDTLQPAKFHWQWVELRLLLNEQAVAEKLEADTSLVEAVRSLSPNPEKTAASENENNFIEILLTRLLVRPDAAPLFSEVVHLLGRSLEDSMLLQVKWFLGGHDVLYGRKSIRQRLMNIAESKGLSTKGQYWRPWGWCNSTSDSATSKGKKRKFEVSSLEEGELVDEGPILKLAARGSTQVPDVEGFVVGQQHVTEKALIELVLPCVDKGSDDSRNTFASDMIKQMNNIEQQINAATRGVSRTGGTATSGIESPVSKGNSRKGIKGGSTALARRQMVSAETVPPSPAALRSSMLLRLQFLLRLFPIICADREPASRNMRHVLASIILRLLGSRVVHEDACDSFNLSGESLFDRLLLVLHGLLSSYQPSWLKLKCRSKSSTGSSKDFSSFDREVVESLQNDLNHMHLPEPVRWRIQTAMPLLSPSVRCLISCQPPSVSPAALATLQPSNPISVIQTGNSNLPQKNPSLARLATSVAGKPKPLPVQQELDLEVDPWTLLEDGAVSSQSSSVSSTVGGSDHVTLRASNWLKGTVRVRRTDLTYIGAVDEES